MIRRLLSILLLVVALPVATMAQEDDKVRVPDEEDILRQTLSTSSPYYYTNLLLKYHNGSEKLTADEYFYLYYGYLYQEDYRPFSKNEALDEMLMLMSSVDTSKPSVSQLEAIIERGIEALDIDPFNPKVLNILAFAYGALGDSRREQLYYDHLNNILATIESTGTGLKEGSPWHVLMFSHAYDLLAAKGYQYGEGKIISRTVEFVPVVKRASEKTKGFYFDYSRIYSRKPDNVVFKRDRTWQINNLPPTQYK